MKISAAQLSSSQDLNENISKHLKFIQLASQIGADLVFFPELSISSYEPTLIDQLAVCKDDSRFLPIAQASRDHKLSIAIGVPLKTAQGISISMLFYHPDGPRDDYSKQRLHPDEEPYFVPGGKDLLLNLRNKRIFPAICYESLSLSHAQAAAKHQAEIYLASVAKPSRALTRAHEHYCKIAKMFSMTVMMSNNVGPCDNFIAGGCSAIWNHQGQMVGMLESHSEGLITYDQVSGTCLTTPL